MLVDLSTVDGITEVEALSVVWGAKHFTVCTCKGMESVAAP